MIIYEVKFDRIFKILGVQPRDKAAMLGVNSIDILREEFT